MAFDLKRVLKVMLFASNGSLSVKDIQTAISRFHEQAAALPLTDEPVAPAEGEEQPQVTAGASETTEPVAVVESTVPAPVEDDEFYRDVPTLVTTTQIREAIEAI